MGDVIELPTENNLPSAEDVLAQLKQYKLAKADMSENQGVIGSLVKNGEEQKNIHRKAFKLFAQCENMDDTKFTEFIVHFVHYLAIAGLAPHPDLFDDERAKDIARLGHKDEADLQDLEEDEDELEEA